LKGEKLGKASLLILLGLSDTRNFLLLTQYQFTNSKSMVLEKRK
jgi:hypothetical protein